MSTKEPANEFDQTFTHSVNRAALMALIRTRKQPVMLTARQLDACVGLTLEIAIDPVGETISLRLGEPEADEVPGVTYVTERRQR